MTTNPPPVAQVLPYEGREALRRAAQVENTSHDPMARERAIEHAIAQLKLKYPHLFKEEHHGCED